MGTLSVRRRLTAMEVFRQGKVLKIEDMAAFSVTWIAVGFAWLTAKRGKKRPAGDRTTVYRCYNIRDNMS